MKKVIPALLLLLFCFQLAPQLAFAQEQPSEQHFFQIKVYHFDDVNQQETTDKFLESAYLPALHRAGIDQVGVFKPHDLEDPADRKIYVLVPFSSLEEFTSIDKTLKDDPRFLSDRRKYLQASHDNPPYNRINTVLLKAFEDAPTLLTSSLTGSKAERVYELRSYESPTEALNVNKVDMFNAGGEIAIFERLGFNAIFYGNVISGNQMPNLMYMTSFENRESRDQHWEAFANDAEWEKLASMEKYQNNVSKSHINLLKATSYSDI